MTVHASHAAFRHAGKLLADLIPRCTDPCLGVRVDSLGCVQWLLRVQTCYRGLPEAEDKMVDAITVLQVGALVCSGLLPLT